MRKFSIDENELVPFFTEKKSFSCILCDARYTTKNYLKIHRVKIHEGKKPFQCKICDKIFMSKEYMLMHKQSVHEGNKPFAWLNFLKKVI